MTLYYVNVRYHVLLYHVVSCDVVLSMQGVVVKMLRDPWAKNQQMRFMLKLCTRIHCENPWSQAKSTPHQQKGFEPRRSLRIGARVFTWAAGLAPQS